MAGMTDAEIGKYFDEVKRVFPGITMSEIHIQRSDGTMALIKFGKDEVGENTNDFSLLPTGNYTAQICGHEWKKTKSGGHMLALTLEITDGKEGIGRKVWDNLNLDCASEEAVKIALRSYKSICLACNAEGFYDGIFDIEEDTSSEYFEALPENLYAHDLSISVGIERGKDDYPDKNKIKAYNAVASKAPASKTSATKSKPSWQK